VGRIEDCCKELPKWEKGGENEHGGRRRSVRVRVRVRIGGANEEGRVGTVHGEGLGWDMEQEREQERESKRENPNPNPNPNSVVSAITTAASSHISTYRSSSP